MGLSPGLLSAGLGSVPAEQTYLDITQGNRVFDSLYDTELPPTDGCGPGFWQAVEERAASAPAEIVPALLQLTLQAAGAAVQVGAGASCTFSPPGPLTAGDAPPRKLSGAPRSVAAPGRFEVVSRSVEALPSLARRLHGDDLLIAIARPPPPDEELLAIGIVGRGFDGNLTSASTRLDGYVLSTDIAPTVLERFGIPVPAGMSGQAIEAEGAADVEAVASLGDRLSVISVRRSPVIGLSLLAWIAVLLGAIALTRGRAAHSGVQLAALSIVYLPLLLLGSAALEPSRGFEQLLVLCGAPLLALLSLAALGGYRGLAVASGLTVVAYSIDMAAGSPLTSLSLLGPNPGLGARFYGIGNELEATLAVLVVAGAGAALAGFAPRLPARRCAMAFLTCGLLFAFVFAAGRLGADVGAAIVFPLGGAVAAVAIAGSRRRAALLVVAAPVAMVAMLALIDLLTGAGAHLTRSVLDAGGLDEIADVAQRRLQLSSRSFSRPVVLAFLPVVVLAAVLAVAWRHRLAAWLSGAPAMRAGLLGALAATLVGTLANDSGGLMLEIGGVYLLAFVGFAWAEAG